MSKISSEARGYDKIMPDIFTLLIYFIRLFSRFTISAIAQQYIRVSSATLEIEKGEQGLSIFGTLSQTREIIVRPQEARNPRCHSSFFRLSPLLVPHTFCLNLSRDTAEVRFLGPVTDFLD
jgi:hypothetical protein